MKKYDSKLTSDDIEILLKLLVGTANQGGVQGLHNHSIIAHKLEQQVKDIGKKD